MLTSTKIMIADIEILEKEKLIKPHIDSMALKSLCQIVEEKLINYGANPKLKAEKIKYGVFEEIEIDNTDVSKVNRFLMDRNLLLNKYLDKGIQPVGIIPYAIFEKVCLKFDLFRFENLDKDGNTHIDSNVILREPERLRNKPVIEGITTPIGKAIFMLNMWKVLNLISLATLAYLGVFLFKGKFLEVYQWKYTAFSLSVELFGYMAKKNAKESLGDHIPEAEYQKIHTTDIWSQVFFFAVVSAIEIIFVRNVGIGFVIVLGVSCVFLANLTIPKTYDPYYANDLLHKVNKLMMPNGIDSRIGEKVNINLKYQPPIEVKKIIGRIYPEEYCLAAESKAFEIVSENITKLRKVLAGIKESNFSVPLSKQYLNIDPIVYSKEEKSKLVIIFAQYGELSKEIEAMEYISGLSEHDIVSLL